MFSQLMVWIIQTLSAATMATQLAMPQNTPSQVTTPDPICMCTESPQYPDVWICTGTCPNDPHMLPPTQATK